MEGGGRLEATLPWTGLRGGPARWAECQQEKRSVTFLGFRCLLLRLTCCRFPADQAALVQGLWTGGQRRGRAPVLHFEFLKKYEFLKTLRFYIFEKI